MELLRKLNKFFFEDYVASTLGRAGSPEKLRDVLIKAGGKNDHEWQYSDSDGLYYFNRALFGDKVIMMILPRERCMDEYNRILRGAFIL